MLADELVEAGRPGVHSAIPFDFSHEAPTVPLPTFETIRSDFELLDDWEDRYRYVIELGRQLAPLEPALKTEATKVRGCASQVWLVTRVAPDATSSDPKLVFAGESDAHIVQGLVAILLSLVDGRRASEVLSLDPQAELAKLGLQEHLTPQRSNGLAAMIKRVRDDAHRALSDAD